MDTERSDGAEVLHAGGSPADGAISVERADDDRTVRGDVGCDGRTVTGKDRENVGGAGRLRMFEGALLAAAAVIEHAGGVEGVEAGSDRFAIELRVERDGRVGAPAAARVHGPAICGAVGRRLVA